MRDIVGKEGKEKKKLWYKNKKLIVRPKGDIVGVAILFSTLG